ncbi:SMC-Scp complex subunit ScpB [Tuanshanicoccus lijuaniae]|nr:SMC-Scp complex subunit ScpB [Aerococcaceae bacterium zg-1292]MBF6625622.1 SMC-Scp complex subunit ScpB [Aerococcaceae bacterium zg-BR9]MBF6977805.1 SMC-Scp complex subunit ScpB [Aerococcaceae bacterium zg-BR22]MBS4455980.1 SMC-Scp complex subunit ScpB [Aerococcaceae bacterium zg-A91]MBS4457732.1 SMC-Scp complex subunit ScpB [Aerococcaceae bacterium zg-BR33]
MYLGVSLKKRVFGILFVAGSEGVTREQLANTLAISLQEVNEVLAQLQLDFVNDEELPIELVNFNQQYRLITKRELESDVEQFAQSPYTQQLSRAAIETLAIIAYRQPITRMGIDEIRGVSSSGMLQKLLLRDLIKEVGRVEAPGRPVLYGITPYFMDYFGLTSLDDLPDLEPLLLNAEPVSEALFSTKQWEINLFDEEEVVD